jgi:hypothetical protein
LQLVPQLLGTGTVTNSASSTTSTAYPAPFGNYYQGALNQMLIRASELTAAGVTPGNLTSLAFDVVTPFTTALSGFSISLKSTSITALSSSALETGFTTVYSNASYVPSSSPGYTANTIVFNTPFFWNGTDNIIVQTCFANTAFTTNAVFNQSTTSYLSTIVYRADLTTVCSSPGSPTFNYNQRPNMRFGGQVVGPGPGTLSWSWNNGGGTGASVTVNPVTTPSITYTVTATDANSCVNTADVTVTVNPIPADPTGTGSEQCGTAIPTASVSSNSSEPTPIFKWYDAASGGNLLQTDPSTTYLSAVSTTTTFYVSEISAAGCESGRTAVTVTVSDPDVLTVSATSTQFVLEHRLI